MNVSYRLRVALGLAAALVIACGALAIARIPAPATAAERRVAAEQRWAARGFTGYRIVSRMGECMQRGEFRGTRLVRVERAECLDNIRTVESLFALVARMESWGLSTPRCAPSGCVCRETRAVQVVYDEWLGYPRLVRLHKLRAVDWPGLLRNPGTLDAALDCTNPPPVDVVTVFELMPIP